MRFLSFIAIFLHITGVYANSSGNALSRCYVNFEIATQSELSTDFLYAVEKRFSTKGRRNLIDDAITSSSDEIINYRLTFEFNKIVPWNDDVSITQEEFISISYKDDAQETNLLLRGEAIKLAEAKGVTLNLFKSIIKYLGCAQIEPLSMPSYF